MPATAGTYLAAHETRLSVATLTRRLSAIAVAHRMAGFTFDTRAPAIADVMRGLRNRHGSAQRHAEALTIPRLRQVLNQIGDSLGDRRDRALLLVGMAAALRRSELVALDVADITIQPEGLRLVIRRSKNDQGGKGAGLPVNRTGSATCPTTTCEGWLAVSGMTKNAVFQGVDRPGRLDGWLSQHAAPLIV